MGSRLDSGLPLSRAWTTSFLVGCLLSSGSVPYSSSRPALAMVEDVVRVSVVVKMEERMVRRSVTTTSLLLLLFALLAFSAMSC